MVKPPEESRLNFGTFSLTVLAAAVGDISNVKIIDATDFGQAQAIKKILAQKPDLIGITAMSLSSIEPVCSLIRSLRGAGFGGTIIVGGHGASIKPGPILESSADAIVYGEGELTFREIIRSGISEEAPGLILMREGKIKRALPRGLLNLDELKTPARHLTKPPKGGIYLLETSRGCPHSCAFCETSTFFLSKWRGRNPENVTRDIRALVKKGALIIEVTDDNFTANPKRALEICEMLAPKDLPLFFIFSARSDDLLREPGLVPALAKAHFLRASIGVETADSGLSNKIGKAISPYQHRQAFTAMRKAGIYTVASFIVGLPGETEEMRAGYIDFSSEIADSATFVPFQPFPGTIMQGKVGDDEPEQWSRECAEKLTLEFRRNPRVIRRLLIAAKQPTIRGALAKKSLQKIIEDNILDQQTQLAVMQNLDSN